MRASSGTGRWLGAYRLADLQLALDAQSIREAVAGEALVAIPTACSWVVGAMSIRGQVVPVVDLRRVLEVKEHAEAAASKGTAAPEETAVAPECVVVVSAMGRTIGLVADRVLGFFEPGLMTLCSGDDRGVIRGFVTDTSGAVFTELDVSRLVAGVDVAVTWNERQLARGGAGDNAAAVLTTNLLVIAGSEAFALPTESIASIEHVQTIATAPYAIAPCRGALEFRGARVPAIDFAELLGLKRDVGSHSSAAVVLKVGGGRIALLVDAVVDLGRIPSNAFAKLGAASGGRGILGGSLQGSDLPAAWFGERARALERILQCDTAVLLEVLERTALAELEPTSLLSSSGGDSAATGARSRSITVLRFQAGVSLTTLLSDVVEVLPIPPNDERTSGGFVASRGQFIPLVNLEDVLGQTIAPGDRHALVIDSERGRLAVGVGRLEGIEVGSAEDQRPPGCVANVRLDSLCLGGGVSLSGPRGRQVLLRIDLGRAIQAAAA